MLKKRCLIFLIIVLISLLVLPFVISTDFSGYKYSSDTFTLNGDNFSILLSKDWKNAYLKYDDKALILANNSCKESDDKLYFLCFKGAIVNFSNDLGKIDEESGETIPALSLNLTYRKPDVSITRVFSKTNPLIMESFDVKARIENKGKMQVNINYVDVIPNDLELTIVSGATSDNGKVRYIGAINPGAYVILEYSLKPLKNMSGEVYGNVSYSYEALNGVIALEKKHVGTIDTVTVVPIYEQNINLEKDSRIAFNLTNHDSAIGKDMNLTFFIPEELSVSKIFPDNVMTIGKQTYLFDTFLEKSDSMNLYAEFKAIKTGNHTVKMNLSYITNGVIHKISKNISINIVSGKITPTIIIDNENIMSNQKVNVKALIKNNDEQVTYYNIKSNIKSEFFDGNFVLDKISQNNEMTLFDKDVIAPTVNKTTTYLLNLSGEYKSMNDESFNFSAQKKITVYPPSELIVISHEFGNNTNESNKSNIKVYIENKRNVSLHFVNVTESIPQSLMLIDGKTNYIMDIGPQRKNLVYFYILQTDNQARIENITTTLRFKETDKEFILKQGVTLNISSKKVSDDKIKTEVINVGTGNYSTEKNKTTPVIENNNKEANKTNNTGNKTNNKIDADVKKISIWKRIILWIDSFF